MNHKGLFSVSDENAILITAQFFEDGKRLTYDRNRIHRYELDLVVRSDITLNQLLNAIRIGLRHQLIENHDTDPLQLDSNPAYWDLHAHYEQMEREGRNLGTVCDRTHRQAFRYRKDKWVHRMEPDTQEPSSSAAHSPENAKLYQWLVCWHVFQECHGTYESGYPDCPITEFRESFHFDAYPHHPVIACGCVSLSKWKDGTMLSIAHQPQIWLRNERDGNKTLQELGFLGSSRLIFDPISCHNSGALLDERDLDSPLIAQFPEYNVSNRHSTQLTPASYQLQRLAPPPPNTRSRLINIGICLGFFGTAYAALSWLSAACLVGYPDLQFLSCPLAAVLSGLPALTLCRKQFFSPLRQWKKLHEPYIQELAEQLSATRRKDALLLEELYPPVYIPCSQEDLIEDILQLQRPLFSRRPDHRDFLHVRIGSSAHGSKLVKSLFSLELPYGADPVFSPLRFRNIRSISAYPFEFLLPGTPEYRSLDHDGTTGYLHELPEKLLSEYEYVDDAPVMMDLRHQRSVGVLFEDNTASFLPFLSTLLLDLCCHHTPKDLQIVLFGPCGMEEGARHLYAHRYKHLLHFHGLLGDLSAFVFDEDHGTAVLDRLHQIIRQRRASLAAETGSSHILVLLADQYPLRYHPLSELLPKHAGQVWYEENDITFLTLTHTAEQLPPYCSHVLKVDRRNNWFYLPYTQNGVRSPADGDPRESQQYRLHPDPLLPISPAAGSSIERDRIYRCFKLISAMSLDHLSRSALPAAISALELCERHSCGIFRFTLPADKEIPPRWPLRLAARMRRYIHAQWVSQMSSKNLAAPVAVGQAGVFSLDLAPGAHGPNLLICANSGSGKTGSLMTILIQLAVAHPPEKLRFLLIDSRGGGICEHLQKLPHVLGTVDHTDGIPIQINNRLSSLQEEMVRRLEQFSLFQVRDYQEYLDARSNLDAHIRKKLGLIPGRDDARIHLLRSRQFIPRLVVAVDHYDDLLLLLGDSLPGRLAKLMHGAERFGIHYVVAADSLDQNFPSDLLNAFQSRLCLKLSDLQVCERLMGSALPTAHQTSTPGRCYLYNSQTGRTEALQLAHTHSSVLDSIRDSFQVTYLPLGGASEHFYPCSEAPQYHGAPNVNGPSESRQPSSQATDTSNGPYTDQNYRDGDHGSYTDRNYRDGGGSWEDRNRQPSGPASSTPELTQLEFLEKLCISCYQESKQR